MMDFPSVYVKRDVKLRTVILKETFRIFDTKVAYHSNESIDFLNDFKPWRVITANHSSVYFTFSQLQPRVFGLCGLIR